MSKKQKYSAAVIKEYYLSGVDIPRVKERLIYERLIRYMLKNRRALLADSVLDASNIILRSAKALAADAKYNQHFYKWMESCSREFEQIYRNILLDEEY